MMSWTSRSSGNETKRSTRDRTQQSYNVTVLARAGYFCGIEGDRQSVWYTLMVYYARLLLLDICGWLDFLHIPRVTIRTDIDWWSLEGFFILSLLVSMAPRWAKYVFIVAFVYLSLSTNPSRMGLVSLGLFESSTTTHTAPTSASSSTPTTSSRLKSRSSSDEHSSSRRI